jgi:hypothetical protein
MNFYIFILTTTLLLQSCLDKEHQQQNNTFNKVSQSSNKNDRDNQSLVNPSSKTTNKTATTLHDFLKSKGWELSETKPATIRLFDSQKTIAIQTKVIGKNNISIIIMRYEDVEKAQAQFAKIDEVYRLKNGRTFLGNNFIIATWDVSTHLPKDQFYEKDYQRLQSDINEFVKG